MTRDDSLRRRAPAPWSSPDPAQIRAARAAAGLTQAQAAARVWASLRAWEDWEAGRRTMPLTAWAVYLHRTGQWTIPAA